MIHLKGFSLNKIEIEITYANINLMCVRVHLQGPDPSLVYRPEIVEKQYKDKEDYRNFEVMP